MEKSALGRLALLDAGRRGRRGWRLRIGISGATFPEAEDTSVMRSGRTGNGLILRANNDIEGTRLSKMGNETYSRLRVEEARYRAGGYALISRVNCPAMC